MTSPGTLFGKAIVYDTPATIYTPVGEFDEMIDRHALDELLRGGTPTTVAVREHLSAMLLGRVSAGTLVLTNSLGGLDVRIKLPDTELARETAELVERRDLTGMSFSFSIAAEKWHEPRSRGANPTRVITRIGRLVDVSVVTWPAYTETAVRVVRSSEVGRSSDGDSSLARRMLRQQTDDLERDRRWHELATGDDARNRRLAILDRHHRVEATMRHRLGPVYRTLPPVAQWCRQHRQMVRT